MELESLLMAQSKLFNFQECLRLIASLKHRSLPELLFAWRAFDELELVNDLASLKQEVRKSAFAQPDGLNIHLLGRMEADEQNWENANNYFKESLTQSRCPILASKNFIGLGIIELFKSNFLGASDQFKVALSYTKEADQAAHENEIVAFLWLAQTANALRDLDLANEYLERGLAVANREHHYYMTVKAHLIQIELALLSNNMSRAQNSLLIAESIIPRAVATKSLKQLVILKERIREVNGLASFKWIQSESRTVIVNPHQKQCVVSDYPLLQKLLEKLLLAKHGLSKEEIFNTLWGGDYHPLQDDNKIYVTVRRLRKMIGDQLDQPKFILRKEDVYLWNTEYGFTRFHQRAFENSEASL